MIEIIQNKNGSRTAICKCGTRIDIKGTIKVPFVCPTCETNYNPFGYELEPETVYYLQHHQIFY